MLRYITMDQLMASVESDLSSFAENGMINRGTVVKILRKVNADIGLKINKEYHTVLEIDNHRAILPTNFEHLQLAYLLAETSIKYHAPGEIFGTVTEEHNIPTNVLDDSSACMINQCGTRFEVTQKFKNKIVTHNKLCPIRVKPSSSRFVTQGCPNLFCRSLDTIEIEDGYVVTTPKEGQLYLSYIGDMTDEEGNLLVLDHPLTTEFYEYAVKKHLLEQWLLNSDADVAQKLVYVKEELRQARIRAISFTQTTEYSTIKNTYEANRARFLARHYSMFV